MATIFQGIQVLDFSQGMAGSLATMILADYGAEVVKVEPPGGDPFRAMPAWRMWNRGKQGIVLDLETEDGRQAARALAARADVVITSLRPAEAERLGMRYEDLAGDNVGLVHCSITAFGAKGAYANFRAIDALVQAKTGYLLNPPMPDGRGYPVYLVRPFGSYGAAHYAIQGITAALLVRERTGRGQKVETSLFQGNSTQDIYHSIDRQAELGLAENVPPNTTGRTPDTINLTYLVVRAKDGVWMQMTNLAARLFPNWMRAIGLEHIYQDPRFKGAPNQFASVEDRAELRRIILEQMLTKTADEWMPLFKRHDVGGEPFVTTEQALDHPQIVHEGGVVEIDDPVHGRMQQIGPLIQCSETPGSVRTPAPLLGEHNELVLGQLKQPSTHGRDDRATPPPAGSLKRPFQGVTVLDFAVWLSAPGGSSMAADLGARVIKVEPPGGDEWRWNSRQLARTFDGKESFVIDLKSPEGKRILPKLLAKADVVLHNLRKGAEGLGFAFEQVRAVNPNVIYVYAGSYGSTGPGAGRPAFGPIAAAVSGGTLWSVGRGNEPPNSDIPLDTDEIVKYGLNLYRSFGGGGSPDMIGGSAVASAIAMGLYARERTGKGQYMETSMILSNSYLCSEDFLRYEGKPARRLPDRDLRGLHALHRLYRCAAGWVFLSCQSQEEFALLCGALGRDELLQDPRYRTPAARVANDDLLIATLALTFQRRPAEEWEQLLLSKDIACVQADGQSYADFFLTDPAIRENEFIVEVEHPTQGKRLRNAPGAKLSLTPGQARAARPFGGDTPAILEELGLSTAEIDDLKQRGIVRWEETAARAVGAGT